MRLPRQNQVMFTVVLAILLLLSLTSRAQDTTTDAKAAKKDSLHTGTVQSIVVHAEGRVFDWVSPMIPIYDNYPFYDICIRTPDHSYVVRYENMGGYYPAAWRVGKEIKLRRDSGQLLLLRYDGELVPTRILH